MPVCVRYSKLGSALEKWRKVMPRWLLIVLGGVVLLVMAVIVIVPTAGGGGEEAPAQPAPSPPG